MENNNIHILTELGILTSFSVAKKITEDEVNAFFKAQKKLGLSDKEIGEMLHKKIVEDIDSALKNNQIPGLLQSDESLNKVRGGRPIENVAEINRLILIVANRLSSQGYNKNTLCYFINAMVNILQLDEQAFEDFRAGTDGDDEDGDGEDGDE